MVRELTDGNNFQRERAVVFELDGSCVDVNLRETCLQHRRES